jgi:hypothetical protein
MEIYQPKPHPPTIRGLIKVHKEGSPIRPIVNWTNTPAYKIIKLIVKKLETFIPLPHMFNVRNSAHLITDLKEIPIDSYLRFASFDITDIYSNVPTTDLIKIIEQSCDQHELYHDIKTEILNLSNPDPTKLFPVSKLDLHPKRRPHHGRSIFFYVL